MSEPPPPPAATSSAAAAEAKARAVAKARAAARAKAVAKAKARARAKAEARQAALRAQARARKNQEHFGAGFAPPASTPQPIGKRGFSAAPNADEADLLTSPLVHVLIVAASLIALGSMLLASLPVDALERVLAVDAHYRSEQVASFVDDHRLDIAVAGVATLLVAAGVALPTVMS